AGYTGSDSFTYKANDDVADSNVATVSITVNAVNQAPVLTPIGNKSGSEGSLLTFTVAATDADDDGLTCSGSGRTAGARVDPATQTLSGTARVVQAGTYPGVTFAVSDGTAPASETIAITIANTNRVPVLTPIGNKSGSEGSLLTFTVAATDAD